ERGGRAAVAQRAAPLAGLDPVDHAIVVAVDGLRDAGEAELERGSVDRVDLLVELRRAVREAAVARARPERGAAAVAELARERVVDRLADGRAVDEIREQRLEVRRVRVDRGDDDLVEA